MQMEPAPKKSGQGSDKFRDQFCDVLYKKILRQGADFVADSMEMRPIRMAAF